MRTLTSHAPAARDDPTVHRIGVERTALALPSPISRMPRGSRYWYATMSTDRQLADGEHRHARVEDILSRNIKHESCLPRRAILRLNLGAGHIPGNYWADKMVKQRAASPRIHLWLAGMA